MKKENLVKYLMQKHHCSKLETKENKDDVRYCYPVLKAIPSMMNLCFSTCFKVFQATE